MKRTSLIFKIIGVASLGVSAYAFYLIATGFGDFSTHNFMIGGFLLPVGMMGTGIGLFLGFHNEIVRFSVKRARHIRSELREDLTEIATTQAEIMQGAVQTTAEAVKAGMTEAETKFCKHCGARIDADSKFCSACGKQL